MLVLSYDTHHNHDNYMAIMINYDNYKAIMTMVFISIIRVMFANQGMFLLVMAFSFLAAQIVSKQVAIKIVILVKSITTKHRAGAQHYHHHSGLHHHRHCCHQSYLDEQLLSRTSVESPISKTFLLSTGGITITITIILLSCWAINYLVTLPFASNSKSSFSKGRGA